MSRTQGSRHGTLVSNLRVGTRKGVPTYGTVLPSSNAPYVILSGVEGRRWVCSYPNATSRAIITAKPNITPMVAACEWPLVWDSGTSSSTTTNIIAPAAKASA